MRLFEKVTLLPSLRKVATVEAQVLKGYAVELGTEVCDSNTAEKLMYTIQQLMLNEQDQKYEPLIDWPPRQNPRNTTFYDLEPWAVMDSNGTVTVDTDKLQTACDYVELHKYQYRYHWAHMLLLMNKEYFSKSKEDRVNDVVRCTDLGLTLILCYLDSSRLIQLAQLPSLWDFDKRHPVAECFLHSYRIIDCAAVIEDNTLSSRYYNSKEGNTLILEVAIASLTARYSESVRQQLITRLIVLRWVGTAILSKGVLPATTLKMRGHVVVDDRPGTPWDKPPELRSRMIPNYDGIYIRLHTIKLIFKAFDAMRYS
jgi:hypothetical protein